MLKVVFIHVQHLIAESHEGHKGKIPRGELGVSAFLDSHTPLAMLRLRKEELKDEYLERLERMSAEISKLED